MFETLKNVFRVKEMRRKLLYLIWMIFIIRIGCQIPVPGVDSDFFKQWFSSNAGDAFNFFDAFTGGSFERMSIFALNITPYITSSIIIQLLTIAIPALEEIKFSLTSNRGCFGGCNFCALTFHQGRILQTRSHESLIEEATRMTNDPEFKGYIHDVGGPTADFRQPSCQKQLTKGVCKNKQCLFPTPCKNLTVDHSDYVSLLRKLRKIPGVKKVFIRSGVRFDYVVADRDKTFLRELVEHHVSGQLRVAPEHVSDQVLKYMGKPSHSVYQQFLKEYDAANRQTGKQQYAVPYFMSSHPGCTMKEAVKLAEYVRDLGFTPEQVQDFYPTPSTLSTCMYYTGIHPLTGEKVYVPKNPHEKAIQRALMQYKNPANRELVLEGLKMTGRMDLVGYGPKCLIRPLRENHGGQQHTQGSSRNAKNSRNSKNNKNSSASAKKNTIRNIHKKNSRGGRK